MYEIFHHVLLITNMFLSLLRSSSGLVYKSTKNTINCQIIQVGPLSFIMNSLYLVAITLTQFGNTLVKPPWIWSQSDWNTLV